MSVPAPASTDWVPLWSLGASTPARQRVFARYYKSTQMTIPHGAWTVCSWDTARFDLGGPHWASGTPTRLTCVVPGTYVIYGNGVWVGAAGGQHRLLQIRLNGGGAIADSGASSPSWTVSTLEQRPTVVTIVSLNAGDYVELFAYQDSGNPLNLHSSAEGPYGWSGLEFAMSLIDGPQGPPGAGVPMPVQPLKYLRGVDASTTQWDYVDRIVSAKSRANYILFDWTPSPGIQGLVPTVDATQFAWGVDTVGRMKWASNGSSPEDTIFYRDAAGSLRVDGPPGNFSAQGAVSSAQSASGAAAFVAGNLASPGYAFISKYNSDANWRWQVVPDGGMNFYTAAGAFLNNWFPGQNVMKTDRGLSVDNANAGYGIAFGSGQDVYLWRPGAGEIRFQAMVGFGYANATGHTVGIRGEWYPGGAMGSIVGYITCVIDGSNFKIPIYN